MQAKCISQLRTFSRRNLQRDILCKSLGKGIEFLEQKSFDISRLDNIGSASSSASGKRFEKNIIPFFANPHTTHTYSMLCKFGCQRETLLFITIGMSVSKKNDVINTL